MSEQGSDPVYGGEEMGMTDVQYKIQYKGMLIDQLRNWKRAMELAEKSGDIEAKKLAQENIDDINEKLNF